MKTGKPSEAEPAAERVNPAAMTLAAAAELLTKAGGVEISVELIRSHLQQGAPTNPDGTINLLHYGAWLMRPTGTEAATTRQIAY